MTFPELLIAVGDGIRLNQLPRCQDTTQTLAQAIRTGHLYSDGLRVFPRPAPKPEPTPVRDQYPAGAFGGLLDEIRVPTMIRDVPRGEQTTRHIADAVRAGALKSDGLRLIPRGMTA